MFYFTGLPQRPFYDRGDFDWVKALEATTPAIRAELSAMTADAGFRPYVEGNADRPRPNNPLLDDQSWSALYLWRGGEIVAENATHFPQTMAALGELPIPRVAGRSPMALFSRLAPGTHIQPHHGLLNTRLICHLPIVVPEGCALRVGAQTHMWREGELVIFDDSFEHEAWNRGSGTRTVLLFEIWRPEIGEDERAELTHLFEAIDSYGPPMVDQG
jgi:aspartyl/asparaginyl beta-hydroxylase (cupin superfamily)